MTPHLFLYYLCSIITKNNTNNNTKKLIIMTTREELQHLSIDELKKAHESLVQCLNILNSDKEILSELRLNGKDMILQLELSKIAIFSRIFELENFEKINEIKNKK